VREGRVLSRIEDPKVPPAWKDDRIARSPSAKVHAVGHDPAGRLRYRYHDNHRERKEREKFEPVPGPADRLPEVRRFTSYHLGRKRLGREKVFAHLAQNGPNEVHTHGQRSDSMLTLAKE
jgi:DNA topoisomerase I